MTEKYNISGYTDVITYAYLFYSARHQKKIAQKESTGQLYTIMCSYISLAFCLEAYLNHVGKLRIENWEKVERKLSQKSRLKRICDLAGLKIDYSKNPFSTVKNLVDFRDTMAHGKSERVNDSFIVEGTLEESDPVIEAEWIKFCNLQNLDCAFENIEILINSIHKSAGLNGKPFSSLGGGMCVKKKA